MSGYTVGFDRTLDRGSTIGWEEWIELEDDAIIMIEKNWNVEVKNFYFFIFSILQVKYFLDKQFHNFHSYYCITVKIVKLLVVFAQ